MSYLRSINLCFVPKNDWQGRMEKILVRKILFCFWRWQQQQFLTRRNNKRVEFWTHKTRRDVHKHMTNFHVVHHIWFASSKAPRCMFFQDETEISKPMDLSKRIMTKINFFSGFKVRHFIGFSSFLLNIWYPDLWCWHFQPSFVGTWSTF